MHLPGMYSESTLRSKKKGRTEVKEKRRELHFCTDYYAVAASSSSPQLPDPHFWSASPLRMCNSIYIPQQLFSFPPYCYSQPLDSLSLSKCFPGLRRAATRPAPVTVAQAFNENVRKGKNSSKQPRKSQEFSRKTGNPWTEGTSEAILRDSTAKKKGNVWTNNDTETSFSKKEKASKVADKRSKKRIEGASSVEKVLISGMMSTKEEELLQPYEAVETPLWSTFVSSNAGIWQGVGSAFSPFTAELEPIAFTAAKKYLYDYHSWNMVERIRSPEPSMHDILHRKVFWHVEEQKCSTGKVASLQEINYTEENEQITAVDSDTSMGQETRRYISETRQTLAASSASTNHSGAEVDGSDGDYRCITDDLEIMEEDYMGLEPGLVFFEDGSYSRGPLWLLEETPQTSNLSQASIFKIEHCLVKGGHIRLRVVHTIEVREGGAAVQVLRLTVFEEEWKGPSDWKNIIVRGATLSRFSKRKRLSPVDLKGHWKIFEIDVSPVYENDLDKELGVPNASFRHFCKETHISRHLPEVNLKTESSLEMDNDSMLWLLGGVYAYMDVTENDMLILGVGWLGKDSTNLVMERLYGPNGNLAEVRSKSEIKVAPI